MFPSVNRLLPVFIQTLVPGAIRSVGAGGSVSARAQVQSSFGHDLFHVDRKSTAAGILMFISGDEPARENTNVQIEAAEPEVNF